MPLSPAEVLAERDAHAARFAAVLMGSIDEALMERFDGKPVCVAAPDEGPMAGAVDPIVVAAYAAAGWKVHADADADGGGKRWYWLTPAGS